MYAFIPFKTTVYLSAVLFAVSSEINFFLADLSNPLFVSSASPLAMFRYLVFSFNVVL
jgi:hypothetical protein